MELFIIIMTIGLAATYTIKTFYNKYKIGKTSGSSCGCTSCDLSDQACSQPKNKLSIDYMS